MEERVGPTESALTHPTANSAVRILDDGRIVLQSGDHVVLVLDPRTGGVTICASFVNIVSGEIKLDGIPVEKSVLLSQGKKEGSSVVDPHGIKRAIRSQ